MKIQFLFWEDCPSHSEAWDRLHDVLRDLGVDAEVERIEVSTDNEARRWSFAGSPTILVNGRDIDPQPDAPARLTCRLYLHEDGRPSPLPSRAMIARAIEAARATDAINVTKGQHYA